jgi:hypothetical protein
MAEPSTLHSAARAYLSAGLCVLPARRAEKRPAVGRWKQYQTRLPTEAELSAWMANNPDAVCILCGQASGNAEILDFDAGGEKFEAWCAKVRAAAPGLLERLVLSRTQSDGRHAAYRYIAAVSGNLKLAQRKVGDKIVTLIETRGEGGLFLSAPTAGYEVIQGDLANLPVLTEAERDILLQAALDLNEYMPPVVDGPALSAENRGLCADSAHNGDCRSHSAAVGQRSPSSAAQAGCSSDNAHPGDCSPHNGDVGHRAPSSVEHPHCAADNPHIGGCSSNNAAVRPTGPLSAEQRVCGADNADRPGDDFNTRGDLRAVLQQHGWALAKAGENEYWRRPGKTSGWSATLKDRVFYVFTSNAAPFEPNRGYSPFAVYALLNAGGDFERAASSLRLSGYGGDSLADNAHGADISAIAQMSVAPGACQSDNAALGQTTAMCDGQAAPVPEIVDPGPMPAEMLRVPGFINEVMDYCLAIAPYPNQTMAFGGALALQAFLAGRKVRDPGNNRTNLYLLGLAHAGAGKDQSRKVNCDIIHAVGLGNHLGLSFASGEGIQDALFQTPAMLFQTDEIDGMLQSINKAKDARHEAIMSTLLTMYSTANSIFPMRRKAGKESPGVIDQPCLVIFGTAIPNHYYQALSERMLTNGFFARMVILEAGPRAPGQEPSIRDLPPRVLETAKWWADYRPGTGNLENWHPVPTIVEQSDEAKGLLVETRLEAEAQYSKAEEAGDAVGTTVWGRVSEQTRKLALLYAVSEDHQSPRIGLAAVEWASRFIMHQTRRMLFMAASHVAENPFHAECLKLMEKLRQAPGLEMPHSMLLKRMKTDAKTFGMLIETMVQQGDIQVVTIPRAGTYLRSYRLAGVVNREGETSTGGER